MTDDKIRDLWNSLYDHALKNGWVAKGVFKLFMEIMGISPDQMAPKEEPTPAAPQPMFQLPSGSNVTVNLIDRRPVGNKQNVKTLNP
jgi:hypothetical protein